MAPFGCEEEREDEPGAEERHRMLILETEAGD